MACKAFRNLEPNPVAYKLNMLKKLCCKCLQQTKIINDCNFGIFIILF